MEEVEGHSGMAGGDVSDAQCEETMPRAPENTWCWEVNLTLRQSPHNFAYVQLHIRLNLKTGKTVRIKSSKRLRRAVNRPEKRKKIVSLAQYEAEAKAEHAAIEAGKASTDATLEEKRDTGQRGPKGGKPVTQPSDNAKPLSLIKAAVCVLQSCGRPMNCKQIVTKAMDARIWAPRNGGLTPANTLSAAIRREIKTKGDASRFTQVERGKFVITAQK